MANKLAAFEKGLVRAREVGHFSEGMILKLKTIPGVKDVWLAGGAVRDHFKRYDPYVRDYDFFVQMDGDHFNHEAVEMLAQPFDCELSDGKDITIALCDGEGVYRLGEGREGYGNDDNLSINNIKISGVSQSYYETRRNGERIGGSFLSQFITTPNPLLEVVNNFDYGPNKIWFDGEKIGYTPHFVTDFFTNDVTLTPGFEMTPKLMQRYNRLANRTGSELRVIQLDGTFHKGHYLTMAGMGADVHRMCLTDEQAYNAINGGRDPLRNAPMVDALAEPRTRPMYVPGDWATNTIRPGTIHRRPVREMQVNWREDGPVNPPPVQVRVNEPAMYAGIQQLQEYAVDLEADPLEYRANERMAAIETRYYQDYEQYQGHVHVPAPAQPAAPAEPDGRPRGNWAAAAGNHQARQQQRAQAFREAIDRMVAATVRRNNQG